MEKRPDNLSQKNDTDEIKKFIMNILANWQWIVLSLAIALTIAFLVNRYTTPIYGVYTTILSKKYHKQRSSKTLDVIQGSEYFSTEKDINWEVNVLKSFRVVSETVKELNWGESYYKEGNLRTTELYPYSPIKVESDTLSENIPYGILFDCLVLGENKFELYTEDKIWQPLVEGRKFRFGSQEDINAWSFVINQKGNLVEDEIISFHINKLESLVNQYRGKLNVGWLAKGSAVLKLSLVGETPQKEIDFLTKISKIIEQFSIDDKNVTAVKTIDFIDSQLTLISDSLSTTGKTMQDFKLKNRELTMGSEQVFNKINLLEEEKYQLVLTNQYLDYLEDYIKNKRDTEVIAPNTIGVEASLLNSLIVEYVNIRMKERTRNTQLYKDSPLYKYQNKEHKDLLVEYSQSILESVQTSRDRNDFQIKEIEERKNSYLSEMKNLLEDEREYKDFQKLFDLNERFYIMLLTEKVTASIAKASQESDYAVLDAPRRDGPPISPKTQQNYIYALVLGLGIPIGIFYLIGYLNPFIISKDDLDRHSDMPLLGMIGNDPSNVQIVCKEKPKSAIAESFRNLRANLQYFLKAGEGTKTILVTSSVSGEGKTFCSANLAYIYAISGKKTLVVGADLRKPALSKIIKQKNSRGLSSYLAGLCEYEELSEPAITENLSIIHSGHVPPNPSELLVSVRIKTFIDRIKEDYEVIIIDSPPIGIVSDALLLTKYSDINIILVRQGTTRKGSLDIINKMFLDGKLINPAIAFNDIDFSRTIYGHKYGYGNRYGYGYGDGYGHGYYDDEPRRKPNLLSRIFRSSSDS